MSYCHWTNADIYIFHDTSGFLCCLKCSINGSKDFTTDKRSELITHCNKHKSRGDRVPDLVFERLSQECFELGDVVGLPKPRVLPTKKSNKNGKNGKYRWRAA